jgi:hypothetical protein
MLLISFNILKVLNKSLEEEATATGTSQLKKIPAHNTYASKIFKSHKANSGRGQLGDIKINSLEREGAWFLSRYMPELSTH